MIKRFFPLIIFLCWAGPAFADGTFGKGAPIQVKHVPPAVVRAHLTPPEIERVKAFKKLIADVDKKSLSQTIDELERADNPQLSLAMSEAVAKTYSDLVREQKVEEPAQKEWLYSMVTMNLAYLQFGAQQDDSGNALNRMIRRKLKEYLPPEVLNHPGFHYTLE